MPRKFTRAELTETITTAQYEAMPEEDRRAFDKQYFTLMLGGDDWVAGDYDKVGSQRRYETGE